MRFWTSVNVGAAATAIKWRGEGRAMVLLIRKRGVVTVVMAVILVGTARVLSCYTATTKWQLQRWHGNLWYVMCSLWDSRVDEYGQMHKRTRIKIIAGSSLHAMLFSTRRRSTADANVQVIPHNPHHFTYAFLLKVINFLKLYIKLFLFQGELFLEKKRRDKL